MIVQMKRHASLKVAGRMSCISLMLSQICGGAVGNVSPPLFDEIPPKHSGLDFVHRLAPEHPRAYIYESGYACGGVCIGDIDGDGKPDILLISGPDDNALFLNRGNFVFEKSVASKELADGGHWGVSAALADVDNDGDLDILVANYDGPNRLWLNNGRGQFTECGAQAGIDFSGPSQCPYFADFDSDGDLDLFLLTNRLYSPSGRPRGVASELAPDRQPRVKEELARFFRIVRPEIEVPPDKTAAVSRPPGPFLLERGYPDRLYRNEGRGSNGIPIFKDVTQDSGIEDVAGHGLSALIWDVNGDGRPDIFVANDYTDEDRLWLNVGPANRGFQFRDATDEFLPYTTWSSMGSDIADVNGDGRLDFFVADMAGTTHFKEMTTVADPIGWRRWVLENGWPRQAMRNMLFLDSGAGRFEEAAFLAGIARSDWTWAAKFGDFDLDGRPDLFLTTGAARTFADADIPVNPRTLVGRTQWEIFKNAPEGRETNIVFRNEGGLRFTNVGRAWNLDKNSMSYGAATGDLDEDGDLDLVVCNLGEAVSLYRNRASETGAHWLKIRLAGLTNRFGVGTIVTLRLPDGRVLVQLMNPQTGFISGSEPLLHFGLGRENQIAGLEVRWTSGRVQQLGPQKADQHITVRESEAPLADPARVGKNRPQFLEIAEQIGLRFRHSEKPFDDYQREPLLPAKLSQFGPGIAVGDVNGDDLDDIFVGGAAGQTGALFVQQRDHTFRSLEAPPWRFHADTEDMGALFFDADRDGDLDLYVASGSNEWEPEDPHYRDHLYLNQTEPGGAVAFTEAPTNALPDIRQSGSCVVGADFDRDGDVDLFVGARSVPGKYSVRPDSTLLRNDSTASEVKFSEITDELALGLRNIGLVTAGLWSDVDNDGWLDLMVTCEWGPVALFLNREGKLINATKQSNLAERIGWWNSITGADFDGDGDIDYVVLNTGLNTKYGRPTAQQPVVLYRGDMDENDFDDLVEATVTDIGELPVRGRFSSSAAMPFLRAKFATYKAFASASLTDIYSREKLHKAIKLSGNEFASGLLINESTQGQSRFSWRPLPAEGQLSPGFGAVTADLRGDFRPALVFVQNLYAREPETGLWRGGLGRVLRMTQNGEFMAESAAQTGVVVSGDGKGLALADLNADAWPDLIAGQNNDALLAFKNNPQISNSRPLSIRLKGPSGNPQGIGARVRLLSGEQTLATSEVYGGSGYLSQSTAITFFHRPVDAKELSVSVSWPTGGLSKTVVSPDDTAIDISQVAQP
jgi:hypothetical protein